MRRNAILATFAVLVLIAGVAGYREARHILSARSLEEHLDRDLAAATDGVYRLRLRRTAFDALHRTFTAWDFAIAPDSLALDRQRAAGTSSDLHMALSAASLRVEHVDLWKLLAGG